MAAAQEIAIVWSWDDGTRCLLYGLNGDLELRVTRNGQMLKRQSIGDLLHALNRTAPALELECLHETTHK
jgi:hypothetical protein